MLKFTIRDLIYVTAIIALLAVWQMEEQQVIEGVRRHRRLSRQQDHPPSIDRELDVGEQFLERVRSSV